MHLSKSETEKSSRVALADKIEALARERGGRRKGGSIFPTVICRNKAKV